MSWRQIYHLKKTHEKLNQEKEKLNERIIKLEQELSELMVKTPIPTTTMEMFVFLNEYEDEIQREMDE